MMNKNYLLWKEEMKKTFNTENLIMELMGDWTIKCGYCGSKSTKIDGEYKKGRKSIPVCEEFVELAKKNLLNLQRRMDFIKSIK